MAVANINNSASLLAQRQLSASQMSSSGLSSGGLSSGLRISNFQHKTTGLDMADRMQAQADRLRQSLNNEYQARAEVQTQEAELQDVSRLLNDMLELRTQADGGSLDAQSREALETQFEAANNEINRIADTNNPLAYRPDYTAALGTRDGSLQSRDDIRKAMDTVTGIRSDLGARQDALNQSIDNLQSSAVNSSSSRPRIGDPDEILEIAQQARAQMLQQAGSSVLSQANAVPQHVLSLLGA